MFCPNYKIQEIKDGFNEIVEALGGQPLTDEEFRSSELRNQRTGVNYSAMESAYKIYHRNGGNMLDMTPSGKHSVLWDTLLDYFDGDRAKTIVAKSNVYSDEFFNWFGDWTENGVDGGVLFNKLSNIFDKGLSTQYDIPNILKNILNLEKWRFDYVDDIMYTITQLLYDVSMKIDTKKLPHIILQHDADFKHYDDGRIVTGGYNPYKNVIRYNIDHLSISTIIHEIIHAFSSNFIGENIEILTAISKIKVKVEEYCENNDINTDNYYGLYKDVDEFIAEFFTDIDFIDLLCDIPPIDNKEFKNIFEQIVDYIVRLLKSIVGFDNLDVPGNIETPKNIYDQIFPYLVDILVKGPNFNPDAVNIGDRVSKVVDENGEPLVVWHHTDDKNLDEFRLDFENYFQKEGGTNKAFFFDENIHGTLNRKYDLPVYLNIKNLNEYNETKNQLHERGTSYRTVVNESAELDDIFGGVHMKDFDDNKMEHQSIWITHSPNQIKHVENLGTWNPETGNIYHSKLSQGAKEVAKEFGIDVQFAASTGDVIFGKSAFEKLLNNESVSSSDVLQHVLSNKAISTKNRRIAEIVKHHDIPIRLSELEDDVIAEISYDKHGQMFILINQNQFGKLSNRLIADSVLHEVIHGVTVGAIDNPHSESEIKFVRSNKKLFELLSNALPEVEFDRAHVDEGFNILKDEKEFAAIYASNPTAREFVREAVNTLDTKKYGRFRSALANFINAFVNLFTDKPAIKTNKSLLDKYKKDLFNHLNDVPQITKGNILNKQLYEAVYNGTSSIVLENDHIYTTSHDAKIMIGGFSRNNAEIKPSVVPEDIARFLLTSREIVRQSNINKEDILKTSQMLENQAEQLLSDAMLDKYNGLVSIINWLIPQVQSDYINVKKMNDMSADDFIDIVKTNFDTYNALSRDIASLMNEESFKNDLIHAMGISEDQEAVTRFFSGTYNDLLDQLAKVQSLYNKLEPKIAKLRETVVSKTFMDVAEAVHDPGAEKWLNNLNKTDEDINKFTKTWGAMDSAEDSGIRAIYHMVEDANKSADDETYDRVVKLLELASKVKRSDLKKLYEVLDDGTTSGYLIRDLNFGKFYNAYDKAVEDINDKINKMFDLHLAKDNRLPPNEEAARKEWNKLRNDWLSKNCHRKFKNEYYEALGDLPEIARKRLSEINNAIFQINMLPGVISKKDFGDEYAHYEVLDDETYERLENLRTQKKELYSLFYDNGRKKTGEDLYIAQELQKYYDRLYGSKENRKVRFEKDRAAWMRALKKELFECGGQSAVDAFGREDFESLEEYIANATDFNLKRWKKWNERNSKFQFISSGEVDEEGRDISLVNAQIMREYGEDKPYYGEEEEAIANQIADLMRPYYKSNGFVNDKKMSRALKKELIELLLKQAKLRRSKTSKNPALEKKAERYGAIINKYLSFEETDAFKELKEEIRKKIYEVYGHFDVDAYYRVIQQYGTAWFDRSTGQYTNFRPYKWYTKTVAKNKYKYMEWAPGDNFINIEESAQFKNDKFDSSYGTSYVPLKSLYENKKFSEIKGDLAELHSEVHSILKDANSKMENRVYVDDYLLPQISGSMYKRMKAHKSWKDKWHAFKDYILEQIGFGQVPQTEEVEQYGASYEDRGDDDTGREEVTLQEKRKKLGLLKTRPDGHPLRMIPQYWTQKKNPEHISQDLIGITMEYFNMAARFKNKTAIKNKCEIIVDALERRKLVRSGGREIIEGKNTNSYQAARKFLDMNLYDIRREKPDFAPNTNYDFLRTTQLLARYTTANNLGANPKVALTGFLTTMWSHFINSVSGNGYSFWDANDAGLEVLWFALKQTCTFGARTIENRLSNDDIVCIAEYYNVANQLERKYKGQNRNPFVDAVYRNSVFGLLSSVDFISKSCIALSVLNSFRFVNGEFVSKDLIYRNAAMLPKDKRQKYLDDTLKEYKKAKRLRSFVKIVDHKFTISEHEEAYKKVHYLVKSRIEKIAERADGMATQAQKAAITQSWIGALILIHRQYLPLMIQERISNPVYDYDMQMYKNGQFRVFLNFLGATARGSLLGGMGAGALLGFLVGDIYGAIPGAILGGIYNRTHKTSDKKSIKETWNQLTNYTDVDDYDTALKNMYNKRALTQVGSEIAIYNIILGPFINALCKYADEPEQKNSKFLQFLCLVARQFQWEAYNPYRFTDIFNTVKNVTAATGSGDVAQDLGNAIGAEASYATRLLFPRGSATPFSTMQGLYDTIENPWLRKVKSGAYKGDTQIFKTVSKAFPWSNIMEQALDSKGKRKWLEGNTMKIRKDDESMYYNIYEDFTE